MKECGRIISMMNNNNHISLPSDERIVDKTIHYINYTKDSIEGVPTKDMKNILVFWQSEESKDSGWDEARFYKLSGGFWHVDFKDYYVGRFPKYMHYVAWVDLDEKSA